MDAGESSCAAVPQAVYFAAYLQFPLESFPRSTRACSCVTERSISSKIISTWASAWPSCRAALSETGIRRHQSIKREAPIETARIGKHPGHRACKSCRVVAPLDIWLADHGRQGAFSEKGDRTRSITPNLGFKPESSLHEFFRQHLIRPVGWPADNAVMPQPYSSRRRSSCGWS
jgi:hypothetical protein